MLKTVLATSLFLASVLGVDTNITSMEEFETFAADASTYDIVRLYTDLDFTGKNDVTPIEGFTGMFYGNGYAIRNFKMTSNAKNVGIFAILSGSTVKDLIIDETCEFKGTYASEVMDPVSIGSVVGTCAKCIFENIINHANVSYEGAGNQADSVYVGGIAGTFSSDSDKPATMKNVANYGAVSNNLAVKNSGRYAAAGGLVGFSIAISTAQKLQFTNCLNYGEVKTSNDNTISGSTGAGGILGVAQGYPFFKNVVSAGSYVNEPSTTAGSVLGQGNTIGSATFENCYTTSDTTKKLMGTANIFTLNESDATTFDFSEGTFDQLNSEANYANVWVNNANEKAITFQVNGNTPYVSTSKIIIAPVLSSESPYFFKGWYSDESCETAYTVRDAPTADTTLQGGWQYTLTIRGNGGKIGEASFVTKEVVYNHTYGALPEATREGYTFANWTDTAEGGNEATEDTYLVTPEDTEIYAQWTINQYTITFNFFNGTDEPLVMTYDYQETVTYPEDPTRFEYTFQKWVSDYGSSLNNKSMPAKNVIVNATWKLNEYQVVFYFYEGRVESSTLGYGTEVKYPADPNRTGYTFAGWDNDNVTTTPSGGITIKAKWNINTYFVTFDFDNGTESLIMEVTYNEDIKYPDNATKKGFDFREWEPYPNKMPAKDFTITAKFDRRVYTYTFVKDGKQVTEIKYAFDQEFKLPKAPKKTMYKFDKWCIKDSDICDPFTADNLPEGAAYFEAKYKLDTAILAVTIVIPGAAVIAVIVVLIILLVMRKKRTARRKVPPKKKDVEMDS